MLEKHRNPLQPARDKSGDKFHSTTCRFLSVGAVLFLIACNWPTITSMVDTNSSSMKSGPSPNVNSDGSVDFDSYMENLQQSIKRAWFPPKTNESKSTVVRFKINEDGQLFGLRLHKPSGDAASDAAALRAVKNAAPFQPLPAGAEGPVDIEFSFDYNLFRSSSNLGNRSNGAASFENSFAIGNVKKFAPGSFPELRSDEPLLKSINPYRY